MRAKPKVRKDGKCAQCRKPRKYAERAHTKAATEEAGRDPFCTSTCAREWYGTQMNCTGCNCPHGETTDGCTTCATRTGKRRKRDRERKKVA